MKAFIGHLVITAAALAGIAAAYALVDHYLKTSILEEEIAQLEDEVAYLETELARTKVMLLAESAEVKHLRRLLRVIECESGWRHNAIGDDGRAFGIAQFHRDTFDFLRSVAQKPHLQYHEPTHQVWLLDWALRNGYDFFWRCATR